MKKTIIALSVIVMACGTIRAGEVGLPLERIALPTVSGNYLVCIWDETTGAWHQGFQSYDHSGTYEFQLPAWGKWYWIGLWDEDQEHYVFSKWIGHFTTH